MLALLIKETKRQSKIEVAETMNDNGDKNKDISVITGLPIKDIKEF